MRWWPRSIRWQMLLGLVLLQALSIALFAILLFRLQEVDVRHRVTDRIAHQTTSLAMQAQEALQQDHPDWVGLSVRIMGEAPSVSRVRITDPAGKPLYASTGVPSYFPLDPQERAQMQQVRGTEPRIFAFGPHRWEGVRAIYTAGPTLRGYAWIESNRDWDTEQISGMLHAILI